MKIGINASFLRKKDTGIGQVTINFIENLVKFEEQKPFAKRNQYFLYLEEDCFLDLPKNFKKRVLILEEYQRDDLFRKIIWEKYLLPNQVKKDRCEKFFSLYQSATVLAKKIPHLMLVHDVIWRIFPAYKDNWRKKIYYFLVDKAIKKASHILTVSQNSKIDIERWFKISSSKISQSYIDCDKVFKKNYSKDEIKEILKCYNLKENNYIFYVGGFDLRKNIKNLLEAFGIFCQKQAKKIQNQLLPDLVLGGNYNPLLVPLVTNLPKEKKKIEKKYPAAFGKIKLIGFIKKENLPLFYQGSLFFSFPSLYEGFGLPVLEAMNCQKAVAVSNVSSLPEIVQSGQEGLLFDPYDVNQIASTFKELYENGEIREKLAQRGKIRASFFNWENFVNDFNQLIGKI